MKIVLASSSPRRKKLLTYLIDNFKTQPSEINEGSLAKLARSPEELVVKLAQAKAKEVAENHLGGVHSATSEVGILVIAADTIVALENGGGWQALSKPSQKADARAMLKSLRGRKHQVFTGVCVIGKGRLMKESDPKQMITDYEVTRVVFRDFSDKALEAYLATGRPFDKAGAYGIQEVGETFVDKIDGSFTNVMGLPVKKTAELLIHLGVQLKPDWQKQVKQETGYED